MIQVTPNVFVEIGARSGSMSMCNLGMVITKGGIVLIDTPEKPSDALKWREEVNKRGKVSYLINTEEHADHWQGSWFFGGVLITSQETRDKLSKLPVAEVRERMRRMDPGVSSIMDSYQVRLADIGISGALNLYLGDHTFSLFPLPGHSTGGIGVYIPQERIVFTTDIVFHNVKSWLIESDPAKWLESLKRLGELDVDFVVPGHGEVCNKDYLKDQANLIEKWAEAVQSAVKQGLSEDEAVARVSVPDPYPPQAGVPLSESEINRLSIVRLYKLYSR